MQIPNLHSKELSSSDAVVLQRRSDQFVFSSIVHFENGQRMACALSKSDLVPGSYQGNISNCLIAVEIAQRLKCSPLMVMQNLYIVHKQPAWKSQYIIACINNSGKFGTLQYRMGGEGDDRQCTAFGADQDGTLAEGPAVSIKMAKAEGWYDKSGSKWKTMPDLMLRYRAATFFGRLYAPELFMGFYTEDEVIDMIDVTPAREPGAARCRQYLRKDSKELLAKIGALETKAQKEEVEQKEGVGDEQVRQQSNLFVNQESDQSIVPF